MPMNRIILPSKASTRVSPNISPIDVMIAEELRAWFDGKLVEA